MDDLLMKDMAKSFRVLSREFAALAQLIDPTGQAAEDESHIIEPTYENARAILAQKADAGYRNQVIALLHSLGLSHLSQAKDPEIFAKIIEEGSKIGEQ